jgi:creatinine amidohydrolase
MPTGVDALLGDALAEYVAESLGDALVAPTLRPACSAFHDGFPGTITIETDTFADLLESYCRSLADTGFRHVVLLSTHGGNVDAMRTYVPEIARTLRDRTDLHFVRPDLSDRIDWEELDASEEANGHHAGFGETALMLSEFPELVDMEMAEAGMTDAEFYADDREVQSRHETLVHGTHSQSPNGILGDPRAATADVGERIKRILGDAIVEEVRRRRAAEPLSAELDDSVAREYDIG